MCEVEGLSCGIEGVLEDVLEESECEARFKVFKKLSDFSKIKKNLSVEVIRILLRSINVVAASKKWRMRSSALGFLARLVVETNLPENLFTDEFLKIVHLGLTDSTAEVRLEAARTLGSLASNFPRGDFIERRLLPYFASLFDEPTYLTRIGVVFIVKHMLPYFSPNFFAEEVLINWLRRAAADRVSNIRIAAIQVLELAIN